MDEYVRNVFLASFVLVAIFVTIGFPPAMFAVSDESGLEAMWESMDS